MVADNLDFESALTLFYAMADMPMDFEDPEGCQVRMSKMLNVMQEQGFEPKIACVFARINEPLWVEDHPDMQKLGGWTYHTAPALTILDENGMSRDLVLDPGLFDGPVSPKQWMNHMDGRADGLKVVDAPQAAVAGHSQFYNFKIKHLSAREIRMSSGGYANYEITDGKRSVALSQECNRFFQKKRQLNRARMGQSWTSRPKMGR